jgi:hypothetical protein
LFGRKPLVLGHLQNTNINFRNRRPNSRNRKFLYSLCYKSCLPTSSRLLCSCRLAFITDVSPEALCKHETYLLSDSEAANSLSKESSAFPVLVSVAHILYIIALNKHWILGSHFVGIALRLASIPWDSPSLYRRAQLLAGLQSSAWEHRHAPFTPPSDA